MPRLTAPATASTEPFWVDGFIPPKACALLLEELEFAFWRPSTVVTRRNGSLNSHESPARVSETTSEEWFSAQALQEVRRIEQRLSKMLRFDRNRFEEWQATRYYRGGRFGFHLDAGYWGKDAAGEREWTVLIYLDTPNAGGATRFKEIGVEVEARAGRLLVWNNLFSDGTPNPWMLHAGAPVRRGRKTILVAWVRERRARP